uniref:Transmembrane protein n=1 Tax=Medicago truncatula TaxID=3880 RepID=I3SIS6_MEDTR|nr:unknown [Medicago truncatula]
MILTSNALVPRFFHALVFLSLKVISMMFIFSVNCLMLLLLRMLCILLLKLGFVMLCETLIRMLTATLQVLLTSLKFLKRQTLNRRLFTLLRVRFTG